MGAVLNSLDEIIVLAIKRGAVKYAVIKDYKDQKTISSYHFFDEKENEKLYITHAFIGKYPPIELKRRWNKAQFNMLQEWMELT